MLGQVSGSAGGRAPQRAREMLQAWIPIAIGASSPFVLPWILPSSAFINIATGKIMSPYLGTGLYTDDQVLMRSRGGPDPTWLVSVYDGELDTQTDTHRVETMWRHRGNTAPRKPRRAARSRSFPHGPQKEPALPTPGFGPPASRVVGQFLSFKFSCLWCFVSATLPN